MYDRALENACLVNAWECGKWRNQDKEVRNDINMILKMVSDGGT